MENKTVYPYGIGGSLPSSIGLINDLITGGVDKGLTAEQGKVIGQELFGYVSGTVDLSDYSVLTVATYAGDTAWRDVNDTPSVRGKIIPLTSATTYTVTFGNGLGGYAVVFDASPVAGQTVNWAPGYSTLINTAQNDIVTIQGTTGQYLFLRADPVSGGRVEPSSITTVLVAQSILKKEDVDEEPTVDSDNPVSSGGVYNSLKEIKDVLPVGNQSIPGKQDIPVSTITFLNKTPGYYGEPSIASSSNRAISSIISIPSRATGIHASISTGFKAIIYYLRADGTWDANVASSGTWSGELYCAAPNYTSAGVVIYIAKQDGTQDITVLEAKNSITEFYFDVLGLVYLPVASREIAQKSVSILFIGNSLTQDAVSYLPYLIKNLYPNLDFRFYIWYNGGYTLGQQYTKFTNDQTCEIFSVCENTTEWTNYNNSVKMSQILAQYTFDIVCLQEYFNYKTTYVEADLVDFNNCLSYIRSNYNRNFKVATLFHAPLRSSAETVFNRTKDGNTLILKKTDAETLIAPGIAVYRALSTSLDSLGDQGHLSPDGTHTQEGLPCLLQTFVVFRWLMRELAIPISIVNCQLRMTSTIYSSINVPGPNLGTGVIPGTDADNALAQDVATLADKEGIGIEYGSYITPN